MRSEVHGPNAFQKELGAFHEPTLVWSPAFRRNGLGPGPAEAETPNTERFKIPMHVENDLRAFHGFVGRARQSPARRLRNCKPRRARSDAPYRFLVPMRPRKRMRLLP